MAYTTVELVKASIGDTEGANDILVDLAVNSATAVIDILTGHSYDSAAAVTRYFTAFSPARVDVVDLLTITSLATDTTGDGTYETTWAATDYVLEPYNTYPKTVIRMATGGRYSFPGYARAVKVVGSWGQATSVPANISHAALLLAVRLYRRKDAVFGVLGSPDMGNAVEIARRDPDVMMLLPVRGGRVY